MSHGEPKNGTCNSSNRVSVASDSHARSVFTHLLVRSNGYKVVKVQYQHRNMHACEYSNSEPTIMKACFSMVVRG